MHGIDEHQSQDASKLPFNESIGVDEIIVHSEWVVAWERVGEALAKPGVVALVGARGAGKTLFLKTFARELQIAGWTVDLVQQGSTARNSDPQIILVDEADRLPQALLRSLASRGRPCVFAGSHALAERLAGFPVAVTTVPLAPLPTGEVGAFLGEQLARNNQPSDLLDPSAVAALAHYSGGEPRRLQLLAGLAVFMARLEDAPRVSASHVMAATEVQNGATQGANDVNAEMGDEELNSLPSMTKSVQPPQSMPLTPEPSEAMSRLGVSSKRASRGRGVALGLAFVGIAALMFAAGSIATHIYSGIPLGRDRATTESVQPADPAANVAAPSPAPAQPPVPSPPAPAPSPAALSAPSAAPAAAPPKPADAQLLPPAVPPRVLVSYPRDNAAAKRRSDAIVAQLRAKGLDVEGPVANQMQRTQSAVDYFFADDAAAAASIAGAIGENGHERLVAPSQGDLPRPGAIEILVAAKPAR